MKSLRSTDQKRLNREWRRRTDQRLGLILDGVQTPFNVGSIVRTAAALRVDDVWLAGPTISPEHPKSRKTSLGTERYLAFATVTTGVEAVAAAREAGYRVVGVELADEARPLADLDLAGDVCLVLGHEEHGVPPATLRACDAVGFVPTPGKVGSLNVAVCAGIALYEARRQSWSTSPPPVTP